MKVFLWTVFTILMGRFSCSPSFAEEKFLNGSASQRQSMSSSVKLMRPADVRIPAIKNAPQQPVNSYLRVTSVDPNAVVPQFRRVRYVTPDGLPAPIRAPAANDSVHTAGEVQGKPADNNALPQRANGIVNVGPQSQSFKSNSNTAGQQAVAQSSNWQLKSKAKLLTQPLNNQERSVNWNEWYKRVARTVYDQWIVNETGPGKVCVQVTVWSTRDIEGRVLRFENAPDSVRTSTQQVAFSKAALQAVNSLENNGILDFPINDRRTKVVFDLDISRLVGGSSGCQVVDTPVNN